MPADQFDDVARIVRASWPARILRRAAAGGRAALPRSVAGLMFMGARRRILEVSPADRVRLGGLVVLTAAISHDVLLRLVPEITRPGLPRALRLGAGVIGLLMMLLAPALERAWRTSTVRRKYLSQSVR